MLAMLTMVPAPRSSMAGRTWWISAMGLVTFKVIMCWMRSGDTPTVGSTY